MILVLRNLEEERLSNLEDDKDKSLNFSTDQLSFMCSKVISRPEPAESSLIHQ